MIRFKWDKIFSPGRDWIKGLACQLMIVVKTRGRIPDANMQKRSIRTFFKEYHDKYPKRTSTSTVARGRQEFPVGRNESLRGNTPHCKTKGPGRRIRAQEFGIMSA